ncbi:hypothetical protein FACS189447_11050 [Spirochaetia bacterium]|nr:hypothetical protein FACS189447_11050 [Spirochaetia bacterium]
MGEYIPGAPINDEVRKQNQNLPGGGGIFNIVNLHVFHYAGNNPIKYIDPDGRDFSLVDAIKGYFISKNKVKPNPIDKVIIDVGDSIISKTVENINEKLNKGNSVEKEDANGEKLAEIKKKLDDHRRAQEGNENEEDLSSLPLSKEEALYSIKESYKEIKNNLETLKQAIAERRERREKATQDNE